MCNALTYFEHYCTNLGKGTVGPKTIVAINVNVK